MRSYTRNSPEAAARVLALTLLADGHYCKAELDVLDRIDAAGQLGLTREALHRVLHTFCEDLLMASHMNWQGAANIDERTLGELMAEIDDPGLRLKLLQLAVQVAEADGQVSDGECLVLTAAVEHWGMQAQMLRPTAREASALLAA
jgi:uncharacterized tellurite resistance protein B-like protein